MKKYSDFNIYTALEYLKDNYVVVSFNNATTYFYKKKDKIIIITPNLKLKVNEKDFIETYKNNRFSLVEENDSSIDLKKDEEYYSWKNK